MSSLKKFFPSVLFAYFVMFGGVLLVESTRESDSEEETNRATQPFFRDGDSYLDSCLIPIFDSE